MLCNNKIIENNYFDLHSEKNWYNLEDDEDHFT